MGKNYSPEDFLQSINEDRLNLPIILTGIVKKDTNNQQSILFAYGTDSLAWTQIPIKMIDNIEHLENVKCKDQEYAFVKIVLNYPDSKNEEATVYANLFASIKRTRISNFYRASSTANLQSVDSITANTNNAKPIVVVVPVITVAVNQEPASGEGAGYIIVGINLVTTPYILVIP